MDRDDDRGALAPSIAGLVERLADLDRTSGGAGERVAAAELADALRGLGLEPRIETEWVHGTYWWPLGLASAAASAAASAPGRLLPAAVAAAAGGLIADDLAIGSRLLRRALPQREAANVVAEIGDPRAARTLVIHAHHDAAHTGLVFHPAIAAFAARHAGWLIERVGSTPAPMWSAIAGPALVTLGAFARHRRLRDAGGLAAAGFAAAMADVGRSPTVPGANDNLSGVAALLSAVTALAADPPPNMRILALSTGSEESFLEGMIRFGERHFATLPRESTYFLCLESVGSPELFVLDGEGFLALRRYPPEPASTLAAEARRLGIPLRDPFRYRFATDGQIPLRAGYPTVTLTSMDAKKAPSNYHWPSDRPDGVHRPSIAAAARLAEAYARVLAAERTGPSTRSSPTLANRPSGSSSARTSAKRSHAG